MISSEREYLAIGAAIHRACRELPARWSIQIELEQDAGCITLYDGSGNTVDADAGGEMLSSQIGMAIDTAVVADRERKGGQQ